jgi:MOSC domain-containing protein YiiM
MTLACGRIHQINVSPGGVPKLPIAEAHVTMLGIEGDSHSDTRNHGGPERALCLYTIEQIRRLQAEGHPIFSGAAGENVTLEGLDLTTLIPGTRLRLGDEVEIELTGYAAPCDNITECFAYGDFTRISQKLHPGESRVYARVLTPGTLHTGDTVTAISSAITATADE